MIRPTSLQMRMSWVIMIRRMMRPTCTSSRQSTALTSVTAGLRRPIRISLLPDPTIRNIRCTSGLLITEAFIAVSPMNEIPSAILRVQTRISTAYTSICLRNSAATEPEMQLSTKIRFTIWWLGSEKRINPPDLSSIISSTRQFRALTIRILPALSQEMITSHII